MIDVSDALSDFVCSEEGVFGEVGSVWSFNWYSEIGLRLADTCKQASIHLFPTQMKSSPRVL